MFDALVLNEASLPFNSQDECENSIDKFFELLHEANLHKIKFVRVGGEGNWSRLNYANNFIFGQWLNDIPDKERQRQVKSVLSNVACPLVDININSQGVSASDILFLLNGDDNLEVSGLGFASLNNYHGLSFSSGNGWMESSISIVKLWYLNSVEQRDILNVPNVSTIDQLRSFIVEFENQRKKNKVYLSELKVQDNADFPNLLFTEKVLKSLKSSSLLPLDFSRVVNVLHKLDKAIVNSNNTHELSVNSGLTITGESDSTMLNRRLKRIRTFKHPDPQLGSKIFEVHVKNFCDGKRMHIFEDYGLNKVCIGYFGNHLKTSGE